MYTKENLEDALESINSLTEKCRKSQGKVAQNTSQAGLLLNRINALSIASKLISKELENIGTNC